MKPNISDIINLIKRNKFTEAKKICLEITNDQEKNSIFF